MLITHVRVCVRACVRACVHLCACDRPCECASERNRAPVCSRVRGSRRACERASACKRASAKEQPFVPSHSHARTHRLSVRVRVLARACLRRRANKHHQRTNRIGDHLERLTSDANSQELCIMITGFNGASGCATGLASGKKRDRSCPPTLPGNKFRLSGHSREQI